MLKKIISAFLILTSTVGCGKAIEDFVRKSPSTPSNGGGTELPSTNSSHVDRGIRISAGAQNLSGSQVGGQVAISPARQKAVSGTHVSGVISINHQQTN